MWCSRGLCRAAGVAHLAVGVGDDRVRGLGALARVHLGDGREALEERRDDGQHREVVGVEKNEACGRDRRFEKKRVEYRLPKDAD